MGAVDEHERPTTPSLGACASPPNGSVSWFRLSKARSAIISGMSRSPRGSGSEASNSSSMINIPASPRQTFGAVRSRRWSWYH